MDDGAVLRTGAAARKEEGRASTAGSAGLGGSQQPHHCLSHVSSNRSRSMEPSGLAMPAERAWRPAAPLGPPLPTQPGLAVRAAVVTRAA